MKKVLAIVIAASVIAAGVIAIGLSSFSTPRQVEESSSSAIQSDSELKPVEEETGSASVNATDSELTRDTYLRAGWPEQSAAVFSSIITEFSEGNSTYVRYQQTLPSGLIRDVRVIVTPGEKYTPIEDDKIYTQFGTVAYVKDAKFYTSPGFYASKVSYFVPYDSLEPELVKELGWSNPDSQVYGLQIPGVQYASATTETTGVEIESTQIRSSPESAAAAAEMDARIATAEADVASTRHIENIFREGGELIIEPSNDPVVQEINRRLTPEAVELRRQQAAFHDAETRQMVDEIRTRYEMADNARINGKWLVRIAGAAGTALAGYELYQIDNQNDIREAWLHWYEECVRNPDIPRFQDPQGRPDPGYEQSIEQIESAREGLSTITRAMYGGSIVNLVAGLAAHNPAVDAMTMLASSLEQGMLDRAAQGELSPLSQLDTPCRAPPCPYEPENESHPAQPSGDYTPGPDEPGFFYTIGPRESYEPPERRICKPIGFNQVRVTIHEVVNEDQGTPRTVTFDAIANVTNVHTVGENLLIQDPYRFFGNGTGNYHETISYPDATLEGGRCDVQIQGVATMQVNILRNMTSDQRNLAEVQVSVVGNLPISQSPDGCYRVNGEAPATTDGDIYGCNFFDVDERGGTYHNGTGPDNDRMGAAEWYYDDCDLIIGPLVNETGVT